MLAKGIQGLSTRRALVLFPLFPSLRSFYLSVWAGTTSCFFWHLRHYSLQGLGGEEGDLFSYRGPHPSPLEMSVSVCSRDRAGWHREPSGRIGHFQKWRKVWASKRSRGCNRLRLSELVIESRTGARSFSGHSQRSLSLVGSRSPGVHGRFASCSAGDFLSLASQVQ